MSTTQNEICRTAHTCDFTDGDEAEALLDHGCCTPLPVKRDCLRPVLPVAGCSETGETVEYDADTEEFFVLGTLYDSNCSALTDSAASTLTALVA